MTRNNPLVGAGYLIKGLELIGRPRLRRFVVVPVLINTVLFSAVIYFSAGWISETSRELLPDWLDWLDWVLVPLFLMVSAVAVFFTFTMLGNLLASPFNGMLAEAVESRLTGQQPPPSSWAKMMKDIGLTLGSELRKLGYIAVRLIPLLLLFFIPVIGAFLWAGFSAWMLAISFADYPMGNHGFTFPEQRQLLAQRRWMALGFGVAVMAAMTVPVVNFIVMPCAVAGATAMWVDELAPLATAAPELASDTRE